LCANDILRKPSQEKSVRESQEAEKGRERGKARVRFETKSQPQPDVTGELREIDYTSEFYPNPSQGS
jgi:hypothetical protein